LHQTLPMPIRYSKHLSPTVFIADLLLLNIAIYIAHLATFHNVTPQGESLLFLIVANIAWAFASLTTKSFNIKRPFFLKDNVHAFLVTLIYHLLLIFSAIYFLKIDNISRKEVTIAYLIFPILIILTRSILFIALDYYRKHGYNQRKIMIIGDKNLAVRLAKSFSQHPEYGYDLSDFISEAELDAIAETTLLNKILDNKPDEIFICFKQLKEELLKTLIQFGEEYSIKIKVVPDIMLNSYAELVNYDNFPVLHISANSSLKLKIRFLKRAFDIIFSSILMATGLPVFGILYIITKTTSKGPAFYKQERIGRNGRPFYIYKFRSMYVDAEKYGPQLSKDNDPRITKWGIIIRKTRLDELPQFWNVLKGEMSVVGPRPERQFFIDRIIEKNPNYKKLLSLRPGITSIGQVQYGYAENVDEMCRRVRYDLIYLDNVNLNADINIIYKTVKVMIQRKGK
jgi:exopolysaccharide biosynthesis polyprenyl glycosylphosphotransferase